MLIRRCYVALWSLLALALLPIQAYGQSLPPRVMKLVGTTPGRVYAGTICGAYEQIEGGARWAKIPGLDDQILDLAQLNDNRLVAITYNKVYRRGPGEPWQRVDVGIESPDALAVSPTGDRVYLLAGDAAGGLGYAVFRSDDSGRTWRMLTSTTGDIGPRDIAVMRNSATGQDIILFDAGLPARGGGGTILMRSLDSGSTWQEIPTGDGAGGRLHLHRIFVDAITQSFLIIEWDFYRDMFGLFRLAPTGNTLEEVDIPDVFKTGGLSALTTHANKLVIAGPKGVFAGSIQGGANTFRPYEQGLNGAQVFDLIAISGGSSAAALYAGTDRGVFIGNQSATDSWLDHSTGMAACSNQGPSPFDRITPFPDSPQRRYFPQTGHSLSFEFKGFWERNGGLPVFGYPLSEEFLEMNADLRENFTTQYLERERFEFHPENREPYRVLLGRLGDELLKLQGRNWRDEGGANNPFPNTPCQSFAVGGQQRSVCGPFLSYWRTHGLEFDGRSGTSFDESLALFGLPLTAPKVERNPDGNEVLTQWFEHARFEYHPNNPEPYRVLLGRLGSELLKARGVQVP